MIKVHITPEEEAKILEELLQEKPKDEISTSVSYDNLVWEPKKHDEYITFDASLTRLKQQKFLRHPRPAEAFGLIAAHLEKKLPKYLDDIAMNMLSGKGEWLSMVMQRNGDTLVCYLDPENLVWNASSSNRYDVSGGKLRYSEKKEFNIDGKKSDGWICADQFSSELIRYCYGREFKQLPQEMRTGDYKAYLYLPPDGKLWPAARGYDYFRYYLNGLNYDGASRGIRRR